MFAKLRVFRSALQRSCFRVTQRAGGVRTRLLAQVRHSLLRIRAEASRRLRWLVVAALCTWVWLFFHHARAAVSGGVRARGDGPLSGVTALAVVSEDPSYVESDLFGLVVGMLYPGWADWFVTLVVGLAQISLDVLLLVFAIGYWNRWRRWNLEKLFSFPADTLIHYAGKMQDPEHPGTWDYRTRFSCAIRGYRYAREHFDLAFRARVFVSSDPQAAQVPVLRRRFFEVPVHRVGEPPAVDHTTAAESDTAAVGGEANYAAFKPLALSTQSAMAMVTHASLLAHGHVATPKPSGEANSKPNRNPMPNISLPHSRGGPPARYIGPFANGEKHPAEFCSDAIAALSGKEWRVPRSRGGDLVQPVIVKTGAWSRNWTKSLLLTRLNKFYMRFLPWMARYEWHPVADADLVVFTEPAFCVADESIGSEHERSAYSDAVASRMNGRVVVVFRALFFKFRTSGVDKGWTRCEQWVNVDDVNELLSTAVARPSFANLATKLSTSLFVTHPLSPMSIPATALAASVRAADATSGFGSWEPAV